MNFFLPKSMASLILFMRISDVLATDFHNINLPLIFNTESEPVKTSACLQVAEKNYGDLRWWESKTGNQTPAELSFSKTISAIIKGDKKALYELSDLQDTEPKNFEQQANAYFEQLKTIQIASTPLAYEFNNIAVFYVKLTYTYKNQQKSFFAPFVFSESPDGSFKFLPSRSNHLGYVLLDNWFESGWGPSTSSPIYCNENELRNSNITIALSASKIEKNKSGRSMQISLNGLQISDKTEISQKTIEILKKIKSINPEENFDSYRDYMTEDGFKNLKSWYFNLNKDERKSNITAFTDNTPFYLYNEPPLVIAYTSGVRGVQVIYLISTNNNLLWVNSSHITAMDNLFKSGPVYDYALTKRIK